MKSYPRNNICLIPTKLPSALEAQARVQSEVDSLGILGISGFNSHGSSRSSVMCPLILAL